MRTPAPPVATLQDEVAAISSAVEYHKAEQLGFADDQALDCCEFYQESHGDEHISSSLFKIPNYLGVVRVNDTQGTFYYVVRQDYSVIGSLNALEHWD